MTLANQSRIFVLSVFVIVTVAVLIYYDTTKKLAVQRNNYENIIDIVQGVFELNLLTTEYLSKRSMRSRVQWKKRHASLTNMILISSRNNVSNSGFILSRTRINMSKIRSLFFKIIVEENKSKSKSGNKSKIIYSLNSQVRLASQKIVSDIERIGKLTLKDLNAIETKSSIIMESALMAILCVFLIMIFWIKKSVLNPILLLKEHSEILISGNYQSKLKVNGKNEISDLALSYNVLAKTISNKITDLLDVADVLEKSKIDLELSLQETESLNVQYSNIFNSAIDAIITIDTRGVIQSSNPACFKMFGYTESELKGNNITIIVSPEHFKDHDQYINNYLHTGESKIIGIGRQLFARHKGGNLLPIHLSIAEMYQDGKKQFCGILRDISEEIKAKELIDNKNRQLEVTNKDLEAYAYSISHDLRSPLRTIDGFSLVLLEDYADKLDDEGKGYLQRIRAGTEKMGGLISELLKMSRIDKEGMHIQKMDLAAMAQEEINQLKLDNADCNIQFTCPSSLVVYGDKSLLQAVIENLLSNSVKYSRKRNIIEIEMGFTGQNSQRVYFIKDNGVGFDMKHVNKLFKAFQRLHKVNEFEGIGIGLATVDRIIKRHKGDIWAKAELDKGATFYFSINVDDIDN